MSPTAHSHSYLMIGGGLQASLLAVALRHHQPAASIIILEADTRMCGNHTWSFHASDVPESAAGWAEALPTVEWPAYHVRFPRMTRRVELPYRSIESSSFESYLRGQRSHHDDDHRTLGSHITAGPGLHIECRTLVTSVAGQQVHTADGRTFTADLVIDCRGRGASSQIRHCGYQKFVGLELQLQEDWPDREPVLMDARVEQLDGFRFFYVLPFERRRVLVEDTRFSDRAELDFDECVGEILRYVSRHGVHRYEILREEAGILPMPYGWGAMPTGEIPLAGGYAGGWFHAATGYSMSLAMRFAETIARSSPEEAPSAVRELAERHRYRALFARTLNRLLFRLVEPDQRWQVFRRFYQVLGDGSIERFYAHEFSVSDAARIVLGRPPQGLTPLRFLRSFEGQRCSVTG